MTQATQNMRRQLVQEHPTLNGVDYVEVVTPPAGTVPTQLRLTFVNPLATLPQHSEVQVAGGERISAIDVVAIDPTDDPDTVLVTLRATGDMSPYVLTMVGGPTDTSAPDWVDPVLRSAEFSFALDCSTDLACGDDDDCPPAAVVEPRLDYLARDWESMRAVLLDRMAVLQPGWTARNVADHRIALVEVIAELADRASYRQDAIATEAYLGTARRRISVRRHARLVDYTMSDGGNARAWVQIVVPDDVVLRAGGSVPVVPEGTRFLSGGADASSILPLGSPSEADARLAGALDFEAMSALNVVAGPHAMMKFYTWSGACPGLARGATSATLAGHLPDLAVGDVIILVERRDPSTAQKTVNDADPSRRQAVRLTEAVAFAGAEPLIDPLTGHRITEVSWHREDALAFPLAISGTSTSGTVGETDFDDGAIALGNILLVDHGRRQPQELLGVVPDGRVQFHLQHGPLTQAARQLISARDETDGSTEVLARFDPDGSAASALSRFPAAVLPEVEVSDDSGPWTVQRDLISSGLSRDFVVEVDDDERAWLRFGRAFSALPANGLPPSAGDTMVASYRTGNGTIGNVGPGVIRTVLDDGLIAASLRSALADPRAHIANPIAAAGGTDPETIEQVRQRAPFAFRRQERAVTASDYARRAEAFGRPGPARVQRAVATIRWTGSWYTVVVAVDPVGGTDADPALLAELANFLDVYRMAGHDLRVVGAAYAPLEVGVAVRLDASYRRDVVRAELLDTMSDRRLAGGALGLFHPDRLSFGATIYLGPIIAAAQAITGIESVQATRFSRYRLPGTDARAEGRIEIGEREIARLDNDPSRPERGRFIIDSLEGGR